MMRALFTAASGMIIQERRQTNVSNNLSNSGTTGFKIQELITKEKDKMTIQNKEAKSNGNIYMREIGDISLGAEIDDLHIDFEQGMLQDSDSDLDFALEGDGFFKIRWDDLQTGYTRNGHFKLDEEGYLSTEEGKHVLSTDNQPIFIGDQSISVTENGQVFLDEEEASQIAAVNLNSISNLEVIGSGVYLIDNAQEITTDDTRIYQNKLESSNVNPLNEMVKMIEISRSFESNQKVVQAVDEMLDKSVNRIGKL